MCSFYVRDALGRKSLSFQPPDSTCVLLPRVPLPVNVLLSCPALLFSLFWAFPCNSRNGLSLSPAGRSGVGETWRVGWAVRQCEPRSGPAAPGFDEPYIPGPRRLLILSGCLWAGLPPNSSPQPLQSVGRGLRSCYPSDPILGAVPLPSGQGPSCCTATLGRHRRNGPALVSPPCHLAPWEHGHPQGPGAARGALRRMRQTASLRGGPCPWTRDQRRRFQKACRRNLISKTLSQEQLSQGTSLQAEEGGA